MLKRLIEFLKNNYQNQVLNDYLDAKYIYLENDKLEKIATALNSGELQIKSASECDVQSLLFHFKSTIILLKKMANGYECELSWEYNLASVNSIQDQIKGFNFIKFRFNDDYQTTILQTDKIAKGQICNEKNEARLMQKVMPVIKGFVSAISAIDTKNTIN